MKRHFKKSLIILLISIVALSFFAITILFNSMVVNSTNDWLIIIGGFLIFVVAFDMVCGVIFVIKVFKELKK